MDHYLRPLLAPRSAALVGASERPGSLGSIVWRNLAEGGFRGSLYAVNPKHRSLFGAKAYASLRDLPGPVELCQQSEHHLAGRAVQVTGWLVCEQQGRLVDQGACHGYAGLLAAG